MTKFVCVILYYPRFNIFQYSSLAKLKNYACFSVLQEGDSVTSMEEAYWLLAIIFLTVFLLIEELHNTKY